MSVVILFSLAVLASSSTTNPYSTKLLLEPPILEEASWVGKLVQMTNWLETHYNDLEHDEYAGLREQTYLIVDSIVRGQRAEKGDHFDQVELKGLTTALSLAVKLDVYGADEILAYLRGATLQSQGIPIPRGFHLALNFPMFTLRSEDSDWSVRFPYYFMLWDLRHFETKAGYSTDLATVSTLFARHAEGAWSQGTIMLITSPTKEREGFRTSWLSYFDFTNADEVAPDLMAGSSRYYRFDRTSEIHTELIFFSTTEREFAVSYMGRDGCYQQNRSEFAVFLSEVKVTPR